MLCVYMGICTIWKPLLYMYMVYKKQWENHMVLSLEKQKGFNNEKTNKTSESNILSIIKFTNMYYKWKSK